MSATLEPTRKLNSAELRAAMVEQKCRQARNTAQGALGLIREMMLDGPGPATDDMADIEETLGIAVRVLDQAWESALRQVRGIIPAP